MELHLQNKTALVLAGGKGIGGAIANRLKEEGARVAAVSRTGPQAENISWIKQDLSERGAADNIVSVATEILGDIDILVLNSGGPRPGSATEIPAAEFATTFETMISNQIDIAQQLLGGMQERKFGRIIAVSSVSIIGQLQDWYYQIRCGQPSPHGVKLSPAKSPASGVTVNMVLPGRIGTDRLASLHQARSHKSGTPLENIVANSIKEIPAGRFGTPDEFAALAAFLASPLASYITGTRIPIDGGLTI